MMKYVLNSVIYTYTCVSVTAQFNAIQKVFTFDNIL